ncbi:hypothetical protein BCR44DRAFT_1438971, partial [Catenaria anguillulae PL171]
MTGRGNGAGTDWPRPECRRHDMRAATIAAGRHGDSSPECQPNHVWKNYTLDKRWISGVTSSHLVWTRACVNFKRVVLVSICP